MRKARDDSDPLTLAIRPAPDETSAERSLREAQEREAKRVSDEIDAGIAEHKRQLRLDSSVKVLLLGQSESGKSTTLKQFQLIFASRQFQKERQLWKLVIQLNLVRSIRIILEHLSSLTTTKPIPFEENKPSRTMAMSVHPLNGSPRMNASSSSVAVSSQSSGMSSDSDIPSTAGSVSHSRSSHPYGASSPVTPVTRSPTTPFSSPLPPAALSEPTEMPKLSDYHRTLRMRLLPLVHIETSLLRRLDPSGEDYEATQLGTNWFTSGKELFVRSTGNWKEKLSRLRGRLDHDEDEMSDDEIDFDSPEDPGNVINACKDDMLALWHDPVVRQVLKMGNVRLEDMPGFFLDDIERITSLSYVPSDDDVLRARLKTIGVSEYTYDVNMMGERTTWTFYDVGGTRTQRSAWQPYFSHVDALIFLAPISAFDQSLAEDRRVNRLEDSLLLFKSICKSKLLISVNIILFLNKVDILQSKLNSGVRVNKYVKSYGERPNEYESVSKFFRNKFAAIYREYTPKEAKKMFYIHMTSVTETKAMRNVLSSVCDSIFRVNLQTTNLT
ncbi:related to guanine nucleotide-binding protein alpha-4 subunit [Serendipita indica DSM 11827]|uniref:Related to guanine nucleotide-binding protein alpha-4 subunit n=1 Tax=Serendipita indica (strain DSM 11827) TaxID=1109443 RepID=G4TBF2_SERID|nr:related to guanine nucleotide-binding protein alpha-4 subunit [Serendipita indica DSM 11827]